MLSEHKNNINNCKNIPQEELQITQWIKEHILAIAIYESRILKRKYKNKDDKEVCKIINKTFADIRDIIGGTDYWNDLSNRKLVGKINTNSNYVHRNKQNDKLFRDEWWKVIKKDVWNVISWVFKDKTVCKEDDIENIPQFFRWFSEWGDDYCQDISITPWNS